MRNINFANLKQRLKNGFVAALFVGAQVGAVTVPFLNAPLAHAAGLIDVSTHEGQKSDLTWSSGNITTYQEGDFINFRFVVTADGSASGQMKVQSSSDECGFFDGSFALGTTVNSSGATPTVAKVGTSTLVGTDWEQVLSVNFAAPGVDAINYKLRLGPNAGQCNGSSTHVSLANVSGDFKNIGNLTVPIPAKDIIELPEIFITKLVDTDGDGQVNRPATAGEWSFTLDGGAPVATNASGQVTFTNVTPNGNHSINEVNGPSSQSFLSGSGTSCTFAGATATANVQSGTTPTNATCIFTNTLTLGSITLIKNVIKDNGGTATANQFGLTTNGTPVTSGQVLSLPLGSYAINEAGLAGYSFVDITGTGCPAALGGNVTLTAAQRNVTCTITNNDIAPQLTVIKHVINDNGGNKTASDFTMNVTGTNVSNASFAGAESPGTTVTLNAGSYSVGETGLSGYASSLSTDCTGTIALGQTKTCTITNNDVAPSLTLNKIISNTHGGTAAESAWTLTATGPTTLSGSGAAGNTDVVSGPTFAAGTYTLSESGGPSGYSPSSWTCTNNVVVVNNQITIANDQTTTCSITNSDIAPLLTVTKIVTNNNGGTLQVSDFPLFVGNIQVTSGTQNSFTADTYTVSEQGATGYTASSWGGDCALNGNITLQVGGVYACTITNDDQPAKITVTKVVVNDNGGTAQASDFALKVNSTTVLTGVTNTFNANVAYTISETPKAGYAQTSLVCTDANTHATLSNPFTPTVGQEVNCIITNDDIAPTLKLVKTVTNDNGGTATTANFQGKISGTNVAWDTAVTKTAGSYTASETVLAGGEGYSASNWGGDCAANGNVTLNIGDAKTCTITNNDIAPQLNVIKHVVNNNVGSKTAGDFTMNVTGTNVSDNSFPGSESGTTVNLDAGAYSVGEDTVTGYTPSLSADCTGTVHVGDVKTCTITNTAQPGSISGYKCEANATATTCAENGLEGWTIYADLNNNNAKDIGEPYDVTDANGAYTITGLAPGSYTIREVNQTDWTQIFPGSPNDELVVVLDQGENSTDNNFGNFHGATISGTKWNDANGNHEFDENESTLPDWTIFIDANDNQTLDNGEISTTTDNDGNYSFANLAPGTYTVCEQMKTGWVQTFPQDNNGCHTVVVSLSGHNYDDNNFGNQGQGTITIIKDAQPDSDQAFTFTGNLTGDDDSNFTLTDDAGDTGHERRVFNNVPAGTYTVTEPNNIKGWELTDVSCVGGGEDTATHERNAVIKLDAGENVTCTFTNVGKASLTVIKDAQPNDAQDFHFTISKQEYSKSFSLDDDSDPTLSNTEVTDGLNTGTYVIHEDETAGWTLADVNCGEGVEFGQEGSYVYVTLEPGSDITCTFTNKKHSTVIVTKYNDLNRNGVHDEDEPLLPDWEFNLTNNQCDQGPEIDNFLLQILDNSSTCYNETRVTDQNGNALFEDVHPDGTFELTETIPANSNWNLSNIHCTNNEENVGRVSEGNDYYLHVSPGSTINCYVGNFQDTGTVTIKKKVTPSTDQGKFNLNINGTTYATDVSDGGTTGAVELVTGDFTASETAGTNTNLGDYEASYSCVDEEGTLQSGTGSTLALTLSKDQNIVCTFTNNKGEILGAVAPPLVNTGNNILPTSIASLMIITTVAGLAFVTRRRNPRINFITK